MRFEQIVLAALAILVPLASPFRKSTDWEGTGVLQTLLGLSGAVVVAGIALAGCPNPNTYGTPRTTPKGEFSHTIAVDGFGVSFDSDPAWAAVATIPMFPTYQLRYGVTDELDFGARLPDLTSIAGDVKWNFLRSPVFDAALDPGVHWYYVFVSGTVGGESSTDHWTAHVVYLHAPLLLGLNLSESVSFVVTPGVSYALVGNTNAPASNDFEVAVTRDGPMGRLSAGFNFRVSRTVALHPEVTYMRSFRDDGLLLRTFGLGINIRGLPSFADTRGRPTE